jgi:hypothetical protein
MPDSSEILPLQYLGVRPSQLQGHGLASALAEVWLPMTPKDRTRATNIPTRYPMLEEDIKAEAALLLSGGVKAEIEALSALDDHAPPDGDFLTDVFLPQELALRGISVGSAMVEFPE